MKNCISPAHLLKIFLNYIWWLVSVFEMQGSFFLLSDHVTQIPFLLRLNFRKAGLFPILLWIDYLFCISI